VSTKERHNNQLHAPRIQFGTRALQRFLGRDGTAVTECLPSSHDGSSIHLLFFSILPITPDSMYHHFFSFSDFHFYCLFMFEVLWTTIIKTVLKKYQGLYLEVVRQTCV